MSPLSSTSSLILVLCKVNFNLYVHFADNSNNPKHMEWLFKPLFAGRMFKDLAVMEKFLIAKCQDLNFTVIKPPQLENRSLVGEH